MRESRTSSGGNSVGRALPDSENSIFGSPDNLPHLRSLAIILSQSAVAGSLSVGGINSNFRQGWDGSAGNLQIEGPEEPREQSQESKATTEQGDTTPEYGSVLCISDSSSLIRHYGGTKKTHD